MDHVYCFVILIAFVIFKVVYSSAIPLDLNFTADNPLISLRNNERLEEPVPRIVGGKTASQGQFPFQVLLRLYLNRGSLAFCGGTLISNGHILTAAHCLSQALAAIVTLGTTQSGELFGRGTVSYLVSADLFVIHPEWNPYDITNDLAIIRLPVTPRPGFTVRPARLPPVEVACPDSLKKEPAFISGWGRVSDRSKEMPYKLQYARVHIAPQENCTNFYAAMSYKILSSQICTTFNGSGTCNGDSGGPLVSATNPQFIIGVTSFGTNLCEREAPNVYTNVAFYLDWINMIISL